MDEATVLICGPEYSASKCVSRGPDGALVVKGFNAGALFAVIRRPVASIAELSALLLALEEMPSAFVIRGAPVCGLADVGVRRNLENFKTPEVGRRWVLIDLDKIKLPDGLALQDDTLAVIEHLVTLLPPEFHGCSYHYQLSSSAGLGDPRKVSVHLWFWLSEPWTDQSLKTWAKVVNKRTGLKLIDTALFNDVQPHYTAAPVFVDVPNPFAQRSALVEKARDAVSIEFIESPKEPSLPGSGDLESGPGFQGWLERIGDHPEGEGFHEPIIRAIASHVSEHGKGQVNQEQLYEVVRQRVLAADRSKHGHAYVEHMASREHIMPAIAGALEKFGDRPASRRRSRLVSDIVPEPRAPGLGSRDAHQLLSEVLDDIIGGAGA